MDSEKDKPEMPDKLPKAEEPNQTYKLEIENEQGIKSDFDFDKEFENGYTTEEFLAEMQKRINAFPWKK